MRAPLTLPSDWSVSDLPFSYWSILWALSTEQEEMETGRLLGKYSTEDVSYAYVWHETGTATPG